MNKKKILIATATYNEIENIKKLIQRIKNLNLKNYYLLIIDDNSPDGTSNLIKDLKKKNKKIRLIIRDKKLGLDSAHKIFYDYAVKKKYDYLVTLDADLSHNPKDILKILIHINNYDFVIGSRYIKGGKSEMSLKRKILSLLGNYFIKFILRTNLNEHTTSLRGFNLKKLNQGGFSLKQIKSKGYSFFMETIYRLKKKNFSLKEIPIKFRDRQHGYSKIPKIELLRTLYNVFRLKIFN